MANQRKYSQETKDRIRKLISQGTPVRDVAKIFNVSKQNVFNWTKDLRKDKVRVSEEQVQLIKNAFGVNKNISARVLSVRFNIPYSKVYHQLRKLKKEYKKQNPTAFVFTKSQKVVYNKKVAKNKKVIPDGGFCFWSALERKNRGEYVKELDYSNVYDWDSYGD